MNDLTEKAATMLDALATKLGVASTQLWEIYVRQQIVNGYEMLVGTVFCLLVAIGLYIAGNKCMKWLRDNDQTWASHDVGGVATAFYVIAFIMLIPTLLYGVEAIQYFLNPEYWAIKDIARTLRLLAKGY